MAVIVGNEITAKKLISHYSHNQNALIILSSLIDGETIKAQTFNNDRDLVNLLLTTRHPRGSVVITYKEYLGDFDRMFAQITKDLDIKYTVICPNGSQMGELPQDLVFNLPTTQVKLKGPLELDESVDLIRELARSVNRLLVITPSSQVTNYIIEATEGKLVDANSTSILRGQDARALVTHHFSSQVYRFKFSAIIMYSEVEIIDFSGKVDLYRRTLNEVAVAQSLLLRGGTLQYLADKLPKKSNRTITYPDVYDAIESYRYRNISEIEIRFDERAQKVLEELGILDRRQVITNIGNDSYKYSNNVWAALFYYYWQIEQKKIEFNYPGLLVCSFLEVKPRISPDDESITSLHDFVDFWILMSSQVPFDEKGISSRKVIEWTAKNYPRINIDDLERLLINLRLKMERYTVKIAGKFTKAGLIERCIPILSRIYTQFIAASISGTFFTASRQNQKDSILFEDNREVSMDLYPKALDYYGTVAVLERYEQSEDNSYEALFVVPIHVKTTALGGNVQEKLELPSLDPKILQQAIVGPSENLAKPTLTLTSIPQSAPVTTIKLSKRE